MLQSFKQLDRILRGQATRLPDLRSGIIDIRVRSVGVVIILLGMLYGLCMGLYSVIESGIDGGDRHYKQMLATIIKVPLLFFLTLVVTFPSLYVFNALVGSRLTMLSLLRLLTAALGVMLAVLASFGTIVAFFSVSTDSYSFMKLLNVAVFAVAGFLGLGFLLQTLHRLTVAQDALVDLPPPLEPDASVPLESDPASPPPPPSRYPGALELGQGQVLSRNVKSVFRIWIIVFGLVGAQMAWVLRPFIGNPDLPFSIFRKRSSNFFQAILEALRNLLS